MFDFALARGDFDSATYHRDSFATDAMELTGMTMVVVAREQGEFAVLGEGEATVLWTPVGEGLRDLVSTVAPDRIWFMGRDLDGAPRVAITLSEEDLDQGGLVRLLPEGVRWMELMQFAPHLANHELSLLATQTTALLAWHRATRFCIRCGGGLKVRSAGWTAQCGKCGHLEYPRTDPAIIAAVLDPDDRLLLVHNTNWSPLRMSLPAGYVDPGESAERTVVRELREEVALEVFDLQYIGSQPWPRPRSLMLTYTAQTHMTEPTPDMQEIDRARFFSREELREAVAKGAVVLPGPAAVAHTVINAWLEGGLG